jgi:hypothetical protein
MRTLPALIIACVFALLFAFPRRPVPDDSLVLRSGNTYAVFSQASGLLTLLQGDARATVTVALLDGDELQAPSAGQPEWLEPNHVKLPLGERDFLRIKLSGDAVTLSLTSMPGEHLRAPGSLVLSSPGTCADPQPSRLHLIRTETPLVVAAATPFRIEQQDEHVRATIPGAAHIALHAEEGLAYGPALVALGLRAVSMSGKVSSQSPTSFRARVRGYDAAGMPLIDVLADHDGHFKTFASPDIVQWSASYGASSESAEAHYEPGQSSGPLTLEAAPGGLLTVRVIDADGGTPLVARVIVRGAFGTMDPNFGPDFRASGAGQVADLLRGEFTTPLPLGKYHVLATKGIEWSIDSADVELKSGEHKSIVLQPRHVVPTPDAIGCDLHVHARPSFDTLVTGEDRVLSLVAAGVEFAVPTEHNVVGDYSSALRFLGLERELAYVPGVEVTPFAPRFGHFGVFPWPRRADVPPFRKTSPSAIFNIVRRDQDPDRILQVNHPWLQKQIGYFDVLHVDTKTGRHELKARMDFDAMEVLNGFEMEHVDAVERSIDGYMGLLNVGRRYVATGSSDSHNLLYGWAGYPRTYALMPGDDQARETNALDPMRVVRALKRGHATISAGPILSFTLGGVGPGDSTKSTEANIMVRAAPWVDVRTVDILADGKVVLHRDLPKRETREGVETGSRDEAEARTLRFSEKVTLPLPTGTHWVLAIARGEETLDRYLPATRIRPIAFTNPIWVTP